MFKAIVSIFKRCFVGDNNSDDELNHPPNDESEEKNSEGLDLEEQPDANSTDAQEQEEKVENLVDKAKSDDVEVNPVNKEDKGK